jgi:hypothetical protein
MSTQAAAVVAAAKKYADQAYKEGTNNDTIFGVWYGMNHQPWCAMFVSKCFDDAGLVKLVAASTKKGFAACDAGYQWFAKNKQVVPVGKAEAGDVVFFNFDKNPTDTEHVGIVVANDPKKGILTTYEGNTSGETHKAGSQANGDGVYLRHRAYSLVMGIGRPKYTS